jgi:hypothetical protein
VTPVHSVMLQTTLRSRPAPIVAALAVLIALAAPALARVAEVTPLDRWYTIEMQNTPAGWMHATRTVEGDRVTTTSSMELRVRRGQLELSFQIDTRFVETTDGRPVEMAATTTLGGPPSTQTYTFTEDGVTQTVGVAGRETTSTLPPPGGAWLTPSAAGEYLAARFAAGATEATLRTLDPLSGVRATTVTRSEITPTTLEFAGREVEAFRTVSVADTQPGVSTIEYLDANGDALKLETAMGGLALTITASDRATATGTPAGEAPEMMASLFITPSRPIRNSQRLRTASLLVRSTQGDLPDLPSTGYQRAERVDAETVRVVVDLTEPAESDAEAWGDDVYTRSSAYLAADDPAIIAMARRAAGDRSDASPLEIANELRTFVHRHIVSKDLSVGFATASEVARSGEGDCTEHAVLLAALLRARDIPSRVVSGLVYADAFAGGRDIFGYHMWTQALIRDEEGTPRWIDLDATLPGSRPFNAAHVALAVSPLEDASPVGGLAELAPLLGRLAIDVERTR